MSTDQKLVVCNDIEAWRAFEIAAPDMQIMHNGHQLLLANCVIALCRPVLAPFEGDNLIILEKASPSALAERVTNDGKGSCSGVFVWRHEDKSRSKSILDVLRGLLTLVCAFKGIVIAFQTSERCCDSVKLTNELANMMCNAQRLLNFLQRCQRGRPILHKLYLVRVRTHTFRTEYMP